MHTKSVTVAIVYFITELCIILFIVIVFFDNTSIPETAKINNNILQLYFHNIQYYKNHAYNANTFDLCDFQICALSEKFTSEIRIMNKSIQAYR